MKYVDEFRDRGHAETLACAIKRTVTRPWTIMKVCGGQTHSIVRFGLDSLLPKDRTLVHGPGCPVGGHRGQRTLLVIEGERYGQDHICQSLG